MSHDRVGTDDFLITHAFLGQMLGSRRATVTLSAGLLQAAGLIRYRRGRVTIVDCQGLEGVSCECYATIKTALDAVLATPRFRRAPLSLSKCKRREPIAGPVVRGRDHPRCRHGLSPPYGYWDRLLRLTAPVMATAMS